VRSGIFLKLMAAFLVVILAAAVTFDVTLGGAWQASLRNEIERNLVQKTQLLAHRVETDRSGHSLADIAAQEAQSAGARVTIIDPAGNVLADSESGAGAVENVAQRKEFAAALSGRVGEDQRSALPILYPMSRPFPCRFGAGWNWLPDWRSSSRFSSRPSLPSGPLAAWNALSMEPPASPMAIFRRVFLRLRMTRSAA